MRAALAAVEGEIAEVFEGLGEEPCHLFGLAGRGVMDHVDGVDGIDAVGE